MRSPARAALSPTGRAARSSSAGADLEQVADDEQVGELGDRARPGRG